jgi:hypothetical protein
MLPEQAEDVDGAFQKPLLIVSDFCHIPPHISIKISGKTKLFNIVYSSLYHFKKKCLM